MRSIYKIGRECGPVKVKSNMYRVTVCAKSPVRSTCHYCIVPENHSTLQFFSLCWCISWDTAYRISLFWDKNFLSESKYKGPHPITKVTWLNSVQLLLYLDAIPCICSQIKSFYLLIIKFVVHNPNTHTNATKKQQGVVTPRDDTIMRLPFTRQDFWRIL